MSDLKILVTGIEGFIGSALARQLSCEGHSVVGVSRSNEKPSQFEVDRIALDLTAADLCALDLPKFDAVVHLAAVAHERCPLETLYKVNVDVTHRLAKSAHEAGVKSFVFLSSTGVYGEQITLSAPLCELSETDPLDDYSKSKLMAEDSLRSLCTDSLMQLAILRAPLVYGDGGKGADKLIKSLSHSWLPLPIKGINNLRSVISVDDLVAFIGDVLKAPDNGDLLVNVADQNPLSTHRIFEVVGGGITAPLFALPNALKTLLQRFAVYRVRMLYSDFLLDTSYMDSLRANGSGTSVISSPLNNQGRANV